MKDIGFNATALTTDEGLTAEDRAERLGQIIFGLCALSKKFDINAYTALRGAVDNAKIEMLDEEVSSE